MPTHIWYIFCPIHDFQADHYKRSIVINKVKAHIRQTKCCEIDCDDIKRAEAPNDLNYYPAEVPKRPEKDIL